MAGENHYSGQLVRYFEREVESDQMSTVDF